jgi:hypothetical protein
VPDADFAADLESMRRRVEAADFAAAPGSAGAREAAHVVPPQLPRDVGGFASREHEFARLGRGGVAVQGERGIKVGSAGGEVCRAGGAWPRRPPAARVPRPSRR